MTPAALLVTARRHATLEEAIRACAALGWTLLEVVTQDEYTHDVVIAAGPHFIVYDTT
jgi:hypothetical protein